MTTNRPLLRGLFFDWSDDEQAWALRASTCRADARFPETRTTLEEWHRYTAPGFTERLQTRLKTHCDQDHQPWPARGQAQTAG